jgi:hypothetical protein
VRLPSVRSRATRQPAAMWINLSYVRQIGPVARHQAGDVLNAQELPLTNKLFCTKEVRGCVAGRAQLRNDAGEQPCARTGTTSVLLETSDSAVRIHHRIAAQCSSMSIAAEGTHEWFRAFFKPFLNCLRDFL